MAGRKEKRPKKRGSSMSHGEMKGYFLEKKRGGAGRNMRGVSDEALANSCGVPRKDAFNSGGHVSEKELKFPSPSGEDRGKNRCRRD